MTYLIHTGPSQFEDDEDEPNRGAPRRRSSTRVRSAAKKSRGMKLKPSRAVGGSAPASKRITSSVGSLSGDDSSDGGAVLLWKTSLDLRRSSDSSSSSSSSGETRVALSAQKVKRSTDIRGKPRAKKRTKN